MTSNFWAELSNDYEKLYEKELGYDVIIYVGENQNIKEIHAHSNILCIRTQYFYSAFFNEWAEKKDGKFIFRKPNISPKIFNIILKFIYCGNIDLKNLQVLDILKLLIAVDELNIHSLINHIKEYFINHIIEFLYQNPIDILEIIYQYEQSFMDLWNFCLEIICKDPKILFDSDKFIYLKAPLLELFLKRNDLNMDEIKIWENLLKWYQQNIKNDSIQDITNIESLIKFNAINSTDFFYKIYHHKDILPQNLFHDLLEFYKDSNISKIITIPLRQLKLDSILIDSNYLPLFASWIDKKDFSYYNKRNIPYDFNLLYRSSQDGFNTTSFHKNCDNKGATIWIAKIQNSTKLIGGYNPLDWDGNSCWKTTLDSFLFNFIDGKNLSTAKLGYVINAQYAVYCHEQFGPHMGNLNCAYSKYSNIWYYYYNNTDHYPNIGIPANIKVEDYEVFQVIKK
ncbi:hypothetical protein C1645_731421 [Glomus cerebriforme]|uniref:BTB/POZ domain-containing protein n=1 Tax=Glomus cerebriforme TaxID=658196 RepID=A0A397TL80_9GLOM|nr:hypothetical protein C1645_731421 [Glomus cerebriforme]